MGQCDFRTLQRQFAAAIRHQADYTSPCGNVTSRRLKVYQDLFLNNVSQFFASTYPTCNAILSSERWEELMRDFLAHHSAHTPYFHFLGQEFLAFLESDVYVSADDPPWLIELADWEWRELEVSIEAAEPLSPTFFVDKESTYQLSPTARLCHYAWPVHQAFPEADLQPQSTFLLIWRDSKDDIHFAQIAPLMATVLAKLKEKITFADLFTQLAMQYGQADDVLWKQAQPFLTQLAQQGVIGPNQLA